MIQIEIDMAEITPESKVKMTLSQVVVSLLAIAGFVFSGMTYLGWIPQRADGQVLDPITKTQVESTYVKKEKLQDTIQLFDTKVQNLKEKMDEFSKKQDQTDEKIDKLNDKIDKLLNRLP